MGVWRRPSARMASAKPGTSVVTTSPVASGVTSRGPKPVPPLVTTSRASPARRASVSATRPRSSATTSRVITS